MIEAPSNLDGFSVEPSQHQRSVISKRPNGYWKNISNIEREVAQFLETHGVSTLPPRTLISEMGASSLVSAVAKYYPGGFVGIRQKLGEKVLKKPHGYWDDKSNIENEARQLMEELGVQDIPNATELKKIHRSSLQAAFYSRYPGGIRALRESLGITSNFRQPEGFLNDPLSIETAIRSFIAENDFAVLPSTSQLQNMGFENEAKWISSYPGGSAALREKLGQKRLQRQPGFWKNLQNIESEAHKILKSLPPGQIFTVSLIIGSGNKSLDFAIRKYYPGGFAALKEKLGLASFSSQDRLLLAYEEALTTGERITFEEFLKGEK